VFNNTQRTVSAARAFARANSQCGHSKSIHMPDGSQEQKYYPCARLNCGRKDYTQLAKPKPSSKVKSTGKY